MNLPINKIIQGDALEVLKTLPSESINCVMTSSPYWALRDYGKEVQSIWDGKENCEHNFEIKEKKNPMDRGGKGQHDSGGIVGKMREKTKTIIKSGFCSKCNAWKGQLGLEPTFDLFIKHLADIFDEVKRVLRKDGTCFINLGDTYNSHSGDPLKVGGFEGKRARDLKDKQPYASWINKAKGILPNKCLTLIPFRFSIEMINRGWILRNVIIWHKPNCMPSSVKDRFTVDFEYIFFFVKNRKYWFDLPREPHQRPEFIKSNIKPRPNDSNFQYAKHSHGPSDYHPQGRAKRTVWKISPKPFPEAHFAVYPEELCEIPIKAGCPEFVCKKCGKGREKILEPQEIRYLDGTVIKDKGNARDTKEYAKSIGRVDGGGTRERGSITPIKLVEKGLTNCKCNAGFNGGIVLDPFMGSGTTGMVALKQNKRFIGIELNKSYIDIAMKRLKPLLEQNKLGDYVED